MKNLLTQLLFFGAFLIYLILISNTIGAPSGATGAPGEQTCGQSGCHATTPNIGNASINIGFANNTTNYVPGESHILPVSIDNPQEAARNGFSIVALDGQNNSRGNWRINSEYIKTINENGRDYITHSEDGSILTAWDVEWIAPSFDVGNIDFYLAVNDANDNGERTGDNIYTTSFRATSQITSSIKSISGLTDISLYPNPVNSQININLTLTETTNLQGILVNSTGQTVATLFQQSFPAGNTNFSIPFPKETSTGLYFLKLENEVGGVKSISLLKR